MRKYDDEFKREAVRKIDAGQSVASGARELGVAESLRRHWQRQTREASADSAKEVIALRRRLRAAEMERDILTKAALIFGSSGSSATGSLPTRGGFIRCGCGAA